MNASSDAQGKDPPKQFIEQVKLALENLYDFPTLQRHPLAQEMQGAGGSSGETGGQHLRRRLIEAIEMLSPGAEVPFRAPQARLYNLLHLHYVEGMTVQEAARELSISPRQAYRDLRRGEIGVATTIWLSRAAAGAAEPRAARLSSVRTEIERLETTAHVTDVRQLIEHAAQAVERLGVQRRVDFQMLLPDRPALVSTEPVVAQQVFVSLLSRVVQRAEPGRWPLTLESDDRQTVLTLTFQPGAAADAAPLLKPVTRELLRRLGWLFRQTKDAAGRLSLRLDMTVRGPVVLVIDDNEGLVSLLERYLSGHACHVAAATNGREGLQLAQELLPSAIILDVMMPEIDGWAVLQRLRLRSETADIPVIVCSVFNDPDLVYSLGGSLFLPKPVRRSEVLAALNELGVV